MLLLGRSRATAVAAAAAVVFLLGFGFLLIQVVQVGDRLVHTYRERQLEKQEHRRELLLQLVGRQEDDLPRAVPREQVPVAKAIDPNEDDDAVAEAAAAVRDGRVRGMNDPALQALAQAHGAPPAVAPEMNRDSVKKLYKVIGQVDRLDQSITELFGIQAQEQKRVSELKQRLDNVAEALNGNVGKAAAPAKPGLPDQDQDGVTDPVPNIKIHTFLAMIQANLQGKLSDSELNTALGIDPMASAMPLPWASQQTAEHQRKDTVRFLVREGLLAPAEAEEDVSQLKSGVWAGQRCAEQNETGVRNLVILRPCSLGGPYQRWVWTRLGQLTGGYEPNLCLDAAGANPGGRLVTATCSDDALDQRWEYFPIGRYGAVGQLRNQGTGLCMSLGPSDLDVAEPTVILEACSSPCQQLWSITGNQTAVNRLRPLPGTFQDDVKPRLGLEHLNLPAPLPEYMGSSPGHKEAARPARIACWVMTSPQNHALKAVVVNNTWGAQCDILLFMSTQHQAGLPTVVLSLGEKEDRIYLWRKSIMAWTFLYKNLLDRADWFVRVDDDTVLNMDNLRAYLATLNPDEPRYLGRRLNVEGADFYSGGATNVLSRNALLRLGNGIRDRAREILHVGDTFADDLEIANTLRAVGVQTEDTRDSRERERFFVLGISDERTTRREKDASYWYFKYSFYPPKEGADCCSTRWIASHYVSPAEMVTLAELHDVGCEAAGLQPWHAQWHSPAELQDGEGALPSE